MTAVAAAQDHLGTRAATVPRSIVLVGPLPPPSGGMANQTRQLAHLLTSEGCEVTVVRANAPYWPAWVARLRGMRALFRLFPFVRHLWRSVGGAELVHVMANSGWAWHLFAAPAIWIAWIRGVPVVVNYRGGDADAFFARQFRLIRPTLARAGGVVVPSAFLNAIFGKYGVATSIVPNVVNLDAFFPAAALPDKPHLLVTRNLEPIYDIGVVIRAFAIVAARHDEARLTVAGSGPDRAMLERTATELGVADRVRFTGRVDNAELPAFYRAASVVVNASLVDNLPISLLEAMASGVPIATTDVGGIPYVVEHEVTALLVPPRDAVAMADAVMRLLEDRPLARRLREAGIEAAQRYAWPNVRGELLAGYARVLRPGR